MATMTLSVIPSPPLAGPGHEEVCGALLVTAEGGGLGFAAILKQSRTLHQWSKEEATNQWKHLKHVRDLEHLLPYTVGVHLHDPFSRMSNLLIGFADGVIVVRTHDGVFTVELGSSRPPKKVSRRSAIVAAFPYLSFCTPGTSS
ncbi:Os06g0249850 [Oryza sativa Japonica Group]|nr:Os06g0249850 [Oryza sativa Japonica Group]